MFEIVLTPLFPRETARVYMRLSKKWREPEIKKARKRGDITSLNTFLSFTAKPKFLMPMAKEAPEATEADLLRQELRQFFAAKLRTLDLRMLRLMDEHCHEMWVAAKKEATMVAVAGSPVGFTARREPGAWAVQDR